MDTLPPEVISYILEYLPFDTRRNVATTNKTLYYSTLHPTLLRKECFVYRAVGGYSVPIDESSKKYNSFNNVLMKTKRTVLQLKLKKLTFDDAKYLTMFENYGDRITYLNLEDVSLLSDACLDAIGTYCQNLEEIEFRSIHELSINKPCQPISKLRTISFNQVIISDKDFNFLIQCAPNLEFLNFIECKILTWPRIIRRFYQDGYDGKQLLAYNSDVVFTDVNIINYLKTAKRIKGLELPFCCNVICKLPEHIKLNSLLLNLNTDFKAQNIDTDIFKSKLANHTSLEKLDVTYIPCCFLSAISKLYNLKYLSITYTTHIKSNCIDKTACLQKFFDSLVNMKNLKTLNVTQCPSFDYKAEVLTPTIADYTMSSLKMLDVAMGSIFKVINLGQNLIDLRIQNGKILQSSDFEKLFKALTNLRHLTIEHCEGLTDTVLLSSPISIIKGLVNLKLIDTRLTHRSLQQIKLFHLENLLITSLSLGSCIETECVLDFEESMKQLSYSCPNLITLVLSILMDEVMILEDNTDLAVAISTNDAYIHYFKHLKIFKIIPLEYLI